MNGLFASSGQSTGASASAQVLPMHIPGQFPLGLIGLITLLSRDSERVCSSTTIQKHQFSGVNLLYGPTFTTVHNYWKDHSFDYEYLLAKWCLCFLKCRLGFS